MIDNRASAAHPIKRQPTDDLVELICSDFSNLDISPIISVVLLFLVPGCLQALQETLAKCVNAGTRVASYHFPVSDCALRVMSGDSIDEVCSNVTDSRIARIPASVSGASFQPRPNNYLVHIRICTVTVYF